MQLKELSKTLSSKKLGQLLKENFGIEIPLDKITVDLAKKYRNLAQQKIYEFRAGDEFYSSERNPAYLGMVMLHQCLGELIREGKKKPLFRVYANSAKNAFKADKATEKEAKSAAKKLAESNKWVKVYVTKVVNGKESIVEGAGWDVVKAAGHGAISGAVQGLKNFETNRNGQVGSIWTMKNGVQYEITDKALMQTLTALDKTNLDPRQKDYLAQAACNQNPKMCERITAAQQTQQSTGSHITAPAQTQSDYDEDRSAMNRTRLKNESISERVIMNRAKRMIREGEMENAEAALAAKDLVDRLQDMIEELSKMNYEELPHLLDAIRTSFGADAATNYQVTANAQLTALLTTVTDSKDQLNNATLVLTGEAQPTTDELALSDEDEESETLPKIGGADDKEEMPSDEEEVEPEPLGRAERQSVKEARNRLQRNYRKS